MDLTTIAQEVLSFLASEGVDLSEDLEQAEQVLRENLMRIGAEALRVHLGSRRLGYEGSARPCSCGDWQRFLGHRPRVVATLLGSVAIRRAYYRCGACGRSGAKGPSAPGWPGRRRYWPFRSRSSWPPGCCMN